MTHALLTAEEVAALLGTSKDWIYAEARAGRIPHVKLGRNTRFRAQSIEEWIADIECGRITATAKRRGAAGTAPGMAQEG
jgi:excisionase family DNA binding protein